MPRNNHNLQTHPKGGVACIECGGQNYLAEGDLCFSCLSRLVATGEAQIFGVMEEASAPMETQIACAMSEMPHVRYCLASSPKANDRLLTFLAVTDPNEQTRTAAVRNGCDLTAVQYLSMTEESVIVLQAAIQRFAAEGYHEWADVAAETLERVKEEIASDQLEDYG